MGEPRKDTPDIPQDEQAALLRRTVNGPTVDNEEQLLADRYGDPNDDGVYGALTTDNSDESGEEPQDAPEGGTDQPRTAGGNAGGLEKMVAAMESWLGTGEPNSIQAWYRERNGNAYAGNFAWCNAQVTRSAYSSDNYESVCFGTDYAYTVAHAARFAAAGQWTAMTNGIAKSGIRRGDIVFFDWDGSSSIAAIDHVGIVTGVSGDYVYTVEGNTANVCARRVRVVHDIAGFGRPKYATGGTVTSSAPARYQVTINGLKYGYGAKGSHVTKVGEALVKAGFGKHYKEGPGPEWGDADTRNYSDYQKSLGFKGTAAGQDADGVPGASTLTRLMGKLPAKKPAAPAYEPFPGAGFFHAGRHSPIVTAMGRRLVAEGCSAYSSGPGPNWTNADRNSYRKWQQKLGYSGSDADGIPGKTSWDKLRVPKS